MSRRGKILQERASKPARDPMQELERRFVRHVKNGDASISLVASEAAQLAALLEETAPKLRSTGSEVSDTMKVMRSMLRWRLPKLDLDVQDLATFALETTQVASLREKLISHALDPSIPLELDPIESRLLIGLILEKCATPNERSVGITGMTIRERMEIGEILKKPKCRVRKPKPEVVAEPQENVGEVFIPDLEPPSEQELDTATDDDAAFINPVATHIPKPSLEGANPPARTSSPRYLQAAPALSPIESSANTHSAPPLSEAPEKSALELLEGIIGRQSFVLIAGEKLPEVLRKVPHLSAAVIYQFKGQVLLCYMLSPAKKQPKIELPTNNKPIPLVAGLRINLREFSFLYDYSSLPEKDRDSACMHLIADKMRELGFNFDRHNASEKDWVDIVRNAVPSDWSTRPLDLFEHA